MILFVHTALAAYQPAVSDGPGAGELGHGLAGEGRPDRRSGQFPSRPLASLSFPLPCIELASNPGAHT